MPDKKLTDVTDIKVGKMTDSEIVKALECCINSNCGECPMIDTDNCDLDKLTLDLINRLQADKKNLQERNVILRGLVDTQKAEIEGLQRLLYSFLDTRNGDLVHITNTELEIIKKPIKAEAYKECIEKVKEYIDTHEHLSCEECECVPISKDGLDNLLKELVGDNNGIIEQDN